jgi:Na(+)/H(+) exchange regulatory cofactor NHE-RF1
MSTEPSTSDDSIAPRPRLCHLKKWSKEQGYGLDLCSNKSNQNLIGNIDIDSPAEATGLKKNDNIIEINNESVKNKSHYDLVAIIRKGIEIDGNFLQDEVIILVIDDETKEYYDGLSVEVNSKMDNLLKFKTPDRIKVSN